MIHYVAIAAIYAWCCYAHWPHIPWGLVPGLALFAGNMAHERWMLVNARTPALPEAPPVSTDTPRTATPPVSPPIPRKLAIPVAYTPDGQRKQAAPPLRFADRVEWDD